MRASRGPQRGFTLISAIFLLVVLSALGAYMASVSGVQHTVPMQAQQGAQAHFAARGGIEWAVHDIVNNAAANLVCTPGSVSFPLADGAAAGFNVSVACAASAVTEGADTYTLYSLDAFASRGTPGDSAYASRRIIATVAF